MTGRSGALVPGGTLLMGGEDFDPEERPIVGVSVVDQWVDEHPRPRRPSVASSRTQIPLREPRALGLGLLLAGVNPKNLMLSLAAGSSLAALGLPTNEAAWSLVVFVVIASLSIALPVIYYLLGGDAAERRLDELKDWLGLHNDAVMAVLFLGFGFDLIANGLAPLF